MLDEHFASRREGSQVARGRFSLRTRHRGGRRGQRGGVLIPNRKNPPKLVSSESRCRALASTHHPSSEISRSVGHGGRATSFKSAACPQPVGLAPPRLRFLYLGFCCSASCSRRTGLRCGGRPFCFFLRRRSPPLSAPPPAVKVAPCLTKVVTEKMTPKRD